MIDLLNTSEVFRKFAKENGLIGSINKSVLIQNNSKTGRSERPVYEISHINKSSNTFSFVLLLFTVFCSIIMKICTCNKILQKPCFTLLLLALCLLHIRSLVTIKYFKKRIYGVCRTVTAPVSNT